jgi:GntR family transcriptional regulator / MocR family aminotransferase
VKLIQELIVIDPKSDIPIYLQIANAFSLSIRQGRLRKGLRIPGSRETARLLNVNRMTVVAAYSELEAQGWLEMIPRKGAFVRTSLPVLAPKQLSEIQSFPKTPETTGFPFNTKKAIPFNTSRSLQVEKLIFNDGFPDVRIAPIGSLIRAMRRLLYLPSFSKSLVYGNAQGTPYLRETLSVFLNDTRGMPVASENILITKGAQMGLYIAASIILKPGDHVIVGQPGYVTATLTFQQLGAIIHTIPVDDSGIDMDKVEKLCQRKKIKLVYVIPHHHNPTTVTLIPERRMRLLELAKKNKFAILEDDYDYDFHYTSKPIMPMASMDNSGNVIYIGTYTKTLAPAIRFGFMVAPASFIHTATQVRKSIDTQGDTLMENAIAELHRDGTITRHIKKSVKLYKERRDNLCMLLQTSLNSHITFKIPDGGMSIWAKFNTADLHEVSKIAEVNGLLIGNGKIYDSPTVKYNSVRIGFASLNFAEQEKAVDILVKSVHESGKHHLESK